MKKLVTLPIAVILITILALTLLACGSAAEPATEARLATTHHPRLRQQQPRRTDGGSSMSAEWDWWPTPPRWPADQGRFYVGASASWSARF